MTIGNSKPFAYCRFLPSLILFIVSTNDQNIDRQREHPDSPEGRSSPVRDDYDHVLNGTRAASRRITK